MRKPLGMIGFDSQTPYTFGNIRDQEIQYLACFVDMMSEMVQDLLNVKSIETENISNEPVATTMRSC